MGKLIFIGLGLYDGRDLSVKGLEILKMSDHVYAEFYTAIMAKGTIEYLENLIDKHIEILTRGQLEDGKELLERARKKDTKVAILAPGDALTATTHIELLLRAKKEGISTSVIHGASVVSVVPGLLGLQYYKFGRTTTLAYPEGDYFPESPYDVLVENRRLGLHTLMLLDIHAQKKHYMTANEGIDILLKINSKRKGGIFLPHTLTCVVARAGSEQPVVAANEAGILKEMDFGAPMHSIVIPGKLHFKESEALMVLAKAPKNLLWRSSNFFK